jgi:hypothetical protein
MSFAPLQPRSHHHPRRTASEHRASRVRRLLQPRSTAPDLGARNSGQQCPLVQRRSSLSPDPRRSTSRLRTCRLMGIWTFATPRAQAHALGWVRGPGAGFPRTGPSIHPPRCFTPRFMPLAVGRAGRTLAGGACASTSDITPLLRATEDAARLGRVLLHQPPQPTPKPARHQAVRIRVYRRSCRHEHSS